ncbi:GntR family transcriptional regulator [Microbacterium sp. SLBN-146]|uniref:GntR family transcriptional regulator n=1 Tax=Microbacterium sp. SLBN-146 TaxID=2768457 RepID=UPI0011532260|nr:GntR family transcriptional regulator [Microbacterium sp. SLBN-146]TQJ29879.1 DNA-binding GntR family transcriptional regulator [Microbacterium sp. SLBN-146]
MDQSATISGTESARNSNVSALAPRQSLRERVEQALASAIISGEMAPGQLYSAPVLAEEFAVSATPVREAMMNLEKRGFVKIVRNKGFRVTPVSDESLKDIVDVRLMLEPPAMRRLAGHVPDAEIPALTELADRIVTAAERGDFTTYLTADTDFHAALTTLLGNNRLTALVSELRSQTRLPGLIGLVASEELRESAREHHELLQFLVQGDGDAAERVMRRHVEHVLGWWAGQSEAHAVAGT